MTAVASLRYKAPTFLTFNLGGVLWPGGVLTGIGARKMTADVTGSTVNSIGMQTGTYVLGGISDTDKRILHNGWWIEINHEMATGSSHDGIQYVAPNVLRVVVTLDNGFHPRDHRYEKHEFSSDVVIDFTDVPMTSGGVASSVGDDRVEIGGITGPECQPSQNIVNISSPINVVLDLVEFGYSSVDGSHVQGQRTWHPNNWFSADYV